MRSRTESLFTIRPLYLHDHSDHSIPNNVSLQQYRRVRELVLEHGGYEAREPQEG